MTEAEPPVAGSAADSRRRFRRHAQAVKRRELRVARAKLDARGELTSEDEAALEALAATLVDRLVAALGGRFATDDLNRGGGRLLDPDRK